MRLDMAFRLWKHEPCTRTTFPWKWNLTLGVRDVENNDETLTISMTQRDFSKLPTNSDMTSSHILKVLWFSLESCIKS